jgi:hypothetical protein
MNSIHVNFYLSYRLNLTQVQEIYSFLKVNKCVIFVGSDFNLYNFLQLRQI